jgi:hypothetical protein
MSSNMAFSLLTSSTTVTVSGYVFWHWSVAQSPHRLGVTSWHLFLRHSLPIGLLGQTHRFATSTDRTQFDLARGKLASVIEPLQQGTADTRAELPQLQ